MNLSIEVDARELQAAFNKAPAKVIIGLHKWVARTTMQTEREVKIAIPPHVDTGQLINSVHGQVFGMKGEVTPTASHAMYVHEGRKPGRMPPFNEGSSLASWARRRGIDPFLVARSIARKGTKKHQFMNEAYRVVRPKAEREGKQTLDDIVRSI